MGNGPVVAPVARTIPSPIPACHCNIFIPPMAARAEAEK